MTAVLCLALAVFPQDDAPNGNYGGFWTWPEMTRRIEALEKEHPAILHRTSLGKTFEGRDIVLLKISDNPSADEDEPEVLLMAGIHPREQQPQIAIMDLLERLLSGYGKSESLTKLVNEREIWILPVFNVDGKVYDMQHGNGRDQGANWRKNRRKNEDGSYGVDLNRNFSVRWGGAPDETGAITYEGTGPLSEPETQALAKFFDERPIRAFADIHSTMRAILHAVHLAPSERDRYVKLTKGMQAAQKDAYRTTEPVTDDPPSQRPGNTGLSNAWSYYTRGIYGVIFEIAGPGFYAKPDDIRREVDANVRGALLHLIQAAGDLPLAKPGSATLRGGKTDKPLLPGTEVSWTPSLEGRCDYAVLVGEDAAIQVTSEFRRLPAKTGFALKVEKAARPGRKVPMVLYVWDDERGRSVERFSLDVAAP